MKIKNVMRITSIALILCFYGCDLASFDSTSPEVYTGSLEINLGSNNNSRSIIPSTNMEIASYDIEGTGPDSRAFSGYSITEKTFRQNKLVQGAWTVTVNAKNCSGEIIATDAKSFEVTNGITTKVDILVVPLTGEGILSLNISWPIDITEPGIEAELISTDNSSQNLQFTITSNSASYASSSISAGYYELSIKLMDGTNNIWNEFTAVRIIKGATSSATWTLATDDLHSVTTASSELQLNIGSDLQNPIDLQFTGNSDTLPLGLEMTVTVNPSETPDSYKWYLNGELLPEENDPEITIGKTLSERKYKLGLIVRKGNIISSSNITFSVIEALKPMKETKLMPLDVSDGDSFGSSVSVSADGNTIVCGAPYDDDKGEKSGSIYIYKREGTTWRETKKVASDSAAYDDFGRSVSVSTDGNTIVCGVPCDDDKGDASGSLYIYKWNGTSWEETKQLASDGKAQDFFGITVAVSADGNTIVSRGLTSKTGKSSIYIYQRKGTTWRETKQVASDKFASSISVSADGCTIVCGSPASSTGNSSIYIYKWNGTIWKETKKVATDGTAEACFSVSADGNTVISGVPFGIGNYSGSIYIYKWNGTIWEESKQVASDATCDDFFGYSVSVSADGNTIACGAFADDDIVDGSGSLYIYKWNGTDWVETKLLASDAALSDYFGSSVSVSADGKTIICGAPYRDGKGIDTGSIYIYRWNGIIWEETIQQASDGAANDKFGNLVTVNGKTIVCRGSGSVYIYEQN